ncbi:MAG: aminotransferase class III-fold pyridoxal phosphate-dependent enzyme, partial [Rhodospirillaceae bacterium]
FPHRTPPATVVGGDGAYVVTDSGRRILDATAGSTACAILGYSHPGVVAAIKAQADAICHVDYNTWTNPVLERLAELLLSQAPAGLDRVYFAGNSGSEAMEAALKLSFQAHWDQGKTGKNWYIAREQSFHGATLQAISLSELPILEFYGDLLPAKVRKIPQHHPLYFRRDDESLDDYARRSARQLEDAILAIGPEKVAGFVGETMLGSLVGDVPPAPGYWKYVREVCNRHDVHLILDEIYCGLGRSGEIYCCSHDGVSPDFLCIGKTLGAGYAPLSAVLTQAKFEDIYAAGQGRIQHGHTHQGHALAAAAALAVQSVVHDAATLARVNATGNRMRERLMAELGGHPFFRDLRGRGMLLSLEYACADTPAFGERIAQRMLADHDIL